MILLSISQLPVQFESFNDDSINKKCDNAQWHIKFSKLTISVCAVNLAKLSLKFLFLTKIHQNSIFAQTLLVPHYVNTFF